MKITDISEMRRPPVGRESAGSGSRVYRIDYILQGRVLTCYSCGNKPTDAETEKQTPQGA